MAIQRDAPRRVTSYLLARSTIERFAVSGGVGVRFEIETMYTVRKLSSFDLPSKKALRHRRPKMEDVVHLARGVLTPVNTAAASTSSPTLQT